jgi:hypothetical protein
MSPAAAAESLDEPGWAELWSRLKAANDGFETILRKWREWHWTPIEIDGAPKKKMGSSVDGMIALAKLGIMARLIPENPLTNLVDQIDDHCWLSISGRAWRIVGIEDRTLFLNSFGEEKQIDLNKAKWEKHTEAAVAVLEATREQKA